jgi:hypothetical protein
MFKKIGLLLITVVYAQINVSTVQNGNGNNASTSVNSGGMMGNMGFPRMKAPKIGRAMMGPSMMGHPMVNPMMGPRIKHSRMGPQMGPPPYYGKRGGKW